MIKKRYIFGSTLIGISVYGFEITFGRNMISVVLPTYNRQALVTAAIQSVLNQTYSDLELIVVDDGSTDNTENVIRNIKDVRVKYVRQKNAGACIARNNGIMNSSGEYIAFQDSDDIWHNDKLERQLNSLKEKKADVVFSRMNKVKDNHNITLVSDFFKEGFLSQETLPFSIGTQTLMGKRDVFIKEQFDPQMPRYQEFELLLRIKEKYSIYGMEVPLVDYIVRNDSISIHPETIFVAWNIILKKNPDFFIQYAHSRDRIARDILLNAKNVANNAQRKELIRLSFKFCKSPKMFARILKWKLFRNV